jgi:hypothetical protein
LVGALLAIACSSGSGTPPESCQSSAITEGEIQAYCQKAASLSCIDANPYEACIAELQSFAAEYASGCCGARAAELLDCGLQHGLRCADTSDDVLFNPACASVEEAFDRCSGSHDNCTIEVSVATSGSTYECDQYAATCENGVCTCTFGPHVGKTFTPSGDTFDETSVAAACK